MRRTVQEECGVHVLIVSFFILVLIILTMLVFGTSMLGVGKSRLQNIANLAALAAVETLLQEPPAPMANDFTTRSGLAVDRATLILSANKIPGTFANLGVAATAAGPNVSGVVEFGKWHNQDDGTSPCTKYPCFVIDNSLNADAVRVAVRTQAGNTLWFPFGRAAGSASSTPVEVKATAAVVERCTAYVLDVSGSTAAETHPGCSVSQMTFAADGWPLCDPVPNAGLFAYRRDAVLHADGTVRADNCTNNNSLDLRPTATTFNAELWYYCMMVRGRPVNRPGHDTLHYQSDYSEMNIWLQDHWERFLVDTYAHPAVGYYGAEPLMRFMLAFNASLREMKVRASAADRAGFIAFEGEMRDVYPVPVGGPGDNLARELSPLIQLTNATNRGIYDSSGAMIAGFDIVHPNFLDRGWVPVHGRNDTNILEALYTAIARLRQSCPARSKKTIILATDGMLTCRYKDGDLPGSGCSAAGFNISSWNDYAEAEQWLLEGDMVDAVKATTPEKKTVLELAREAEIAITVLLDGDHVQPNYLYRRNPAVADCDLDRCFLSPNLGRTMGLGGFTPALATGSHMDTRLPFVDISSTGTPSGDVNVRKGVIKGEPGNIFRRPNGLFGRLAMDTGGVFCPLMPQGTAGDYAGTPGNAFVGETFLSAQAEGAPFLINPNNLSKSQQAVQCARQALGQAPYVLVEEQPYLP